KYPLQYLYGFAHRPAVGVWPEETPLTAGGTPVIGDTRIGMRTEPQIGVGLVVAKQNVVARLESFDEVVFEQQGLGLAAGHCDFDTLHPRHHVGDARA